MRDFRRGHATHDALARALLVSRLGSRGLVAFGAVVWLAARSWPPALTLAAATAAWLAVDVGLWVLRYGLAVTR
jgi:hypothetical protein